MSSASNERQGQQSDVPAAKNPAESEKQAVKPASEKKKAKGQANQIEPSVPDKKEPADVEQQEPDASSTVSPEVATPVEQTVTGTSEAAVAVAKEDPPAADEVEEDEELEKKELEKKAASQESDYPVPTSLNTKEEFSWDEEKDAVENYVNLGEKLAAAGDLYRNTAYAGGLLLASKSRNVPPKPILDGRALAAVIVDRIRIKVFKDGKVKGSRVPSADLGTMLVSEVFLQKFKPIDEVTRVPRYLPSFTLTETGYNDGGRGNRIYYAGDEPRVEREPEAITKFLGVMDFASTADRTNAVGAALTVMLHNHFAGAKPLIAVTATKSQAGKDTIILFAAGSNRLTSVSYQATDWAFERAIVGTMNHSPDTVVLNVENARMGSKQKSIASGFLERFLTDPEPTLFSTGTGGPVRRKNNLVVAISTNYGMLSTDLLNRALPIHLDQVGNVADRESPIGNPKLQFLPANRAQIEAELRGMIQRWTEAGRPLNRDVHHSFDQWAALIGGILDVNGFKDFLANYVIRKTSQDPLRYGLGLIGAYKPGEWHTPAEWADEAVDLGVMKSVIPEADQGTEKGRERGMGVVLSAHREETFHAETDTEQLVLRLHKARRRFKEKEEPCTKYMFEVLKKQTLPLDKEE